MNPNALKFELIHVLQQQQQQKNEKLRQGRFWTKSSHVK